MVAAVALILVGVGLVAFAVVRAVTDGEGPASGEGTPLAEALAAAEPAGELFPGLDEAEVAVGGESLSVVIVDEPGERSQGLRGRRDLGDYDGMLFVYDADATTPYTMAGVPVPLDVGFYGADGSEVDRLEMVPCAGTDGTCPPYVSAGPFRFALETLAGGLPAGRLTG
jgi:uncharacterized membrane protein (UPF0127 family)